MTFLAITVFVAIGGMCVLAKVELAEQATDLRVYK